MSINVVDFPTDRYNRYSTLIKELVKASGVADRSEDNREHLMKVLDVIAEKHGRNVVRKPVRKTKKKTEE